MLPSITADDLRIFRDAVGKSFTQFVDSIVRASAAKLSIPAIDVHTNVRTSRPDGGVDTHVDTGGRDPDERLNGPTLWQYKARDFKDVADNLSEEIEGSSKEYARELIRKGYAYRLCICHDESPEAKIALQEELNKLVQKVNPSAPKAFVLLASDLAFWANRYPSVVAKLRGVPVDLFRFFDSWEVAAVRDTPTFVPTEHFAALKTQLENYLDWSRKPIETPRVFGDAGVGKTRSVFEILRGQPNQRELVLYTSDEESAIRIATLLVNDKTLSAILVADECLSHARSYLSAMGIKPPQEKFKIPDRINGIAAQAGAGGRAECMIRKTPVPVTYVDFHAQFASVSKLLDCREILCAESSEFTDFTVGARQMVERAKLDDCFRPAFWKKLRWFALVEPNEDVVPIRAKFGLQADSDPTLAWNSASSKQPFWMTGADVIAAKLMTGKPIRILEAVKVVPHGMQPGLVPVKLRSQMNVDPRRDDLAVKLVELRSAMKSMSPELAGGLKVSANSAAFGIFSQLDVRSLDSRSALRVFSGETDYLTPLVEIWERSSEFYCPVIGSLVTGGSHLLCAMLERMVGDMGGQIAAMDTDSAMIVSIKDGGLVPCAGGPYRLPNYQGGSGNAAIRALSWDEVECIRERFEPLNPWRKTLKTPFLKLEKENFDANGNRQQLNFYGISAKLYCLFNLDGNNLLVRKPSGHGLGFLQAPYTIADWQRRTGRKWKEQLSPWIFETWHFILSRELGLPHRPPSWLQQPAVMSVAITTPQVWARLGMFKDDLRPFTVVTVPFPKRETVKDPLWTGYFIMPHTEKLNDLHGRTMVNVVSGETFHIYDKNLSRLPKPPAWLSLRTMEDEINRIVSRAESKFCDPNGSSCTSRTVGLPARRHIVAGEFHYIGKEASTRWGGGVHLSMLAEAGALDPADETFREYERVVDPHYLEEIRAQAKQSPIATGQTCRAHNQKVQEWKKHDQASFSPKADKSFP